MKQLTVRGFDDELTRRIRQLASRKGISLNRAALRLLRRGAGLGEPDGGPDIVGAPGSGSSRSTRAEAAGTSYEHAPG